MFCWTKVTENKDTLQTGKERKKVSAMRFTYVRSKKETHTARRNISLLSGNRSQIATVTSNLGGYQNIAPSPGGKHPSNKHNSSRYDTNVPRKLFWSPNFFSYETRECRFTGVMDGTPRRRSSKQAWNCILRSCPACHDNDLCKPLTDELFESFT